MRKLLVPVFVAASLALAQLPGRAPFGLLGGSGGILITNTIAFFDKTTAQGCPSNWTELTGARGYFLTGLVSGGTRGTAVGAALSDQEDRTHTHTMAHTHTITNTHTYSFTTSGPSTSMSKTVFPAVIVSTDAHTHTGSGTTSGSSQASSGSESVSNTGNNSTTITPYLQYLLCKASGAVPLPISLIAYYNRTTATGCPAGWAELTAARGAYLVGLTNGGTKGSLVGSALTDLENRHHTHTITHVHSLSAHTHTFSGTTSGPSSTTNVSGVGSGHDANTSAHTHTFSGTSGAPSPDLTGSASTGSSGNESTVIAPYMELLFCKTSATGIIPSGAMMYFDAAACPTGWTEFTAGRGLYFVGLTNGGTKAVAVGSALTNQEDRTHTHTFPHTHSMSHTHLISGTTSARVGGQPAADGAGVGVSDDHSHTFSVSSADSSAANTGSESVANTGTASTIAPYMQYILCSRT